MDGASNSGIYKALILSVEEGAMTIWRYRGRL
jgi:hypothetical protein